MAECEQEWCSVCDQPYETIGPSPARGHDCIAALLKALAQAERERDELASALAALTDAMADAALAAEEAADV